MTKTKQNHKSPNEVANELADQKEMEIDKVCADQLESTLKEYGRALQPFIVTTEGGVFPRVRLVRQPSEAEVTDMEADVEEAA